MSNEYRLTDRRDGGALQGLETLCAGGSMNCRIWLALPFDMFCVRMYVYEEGKRITSFFR